jgi:hypothetical protein
VKLRESGRQHRDYLAEVDYRPYTDGEAVRRRIWGEEYSLEPFKRPND